MKLSVAGKVAIQALTMLGSYSLVKAQTCTDLAAGTSTPQEKF
jgi:hypothetical protein